MLISFYESWITDAISFRQMQFYLMEFLKRVLFQLKLSPSADEVKACKVKTAFARCPDCPASPHRESRTCGSGRLYLKRCWTRLSSTWWRTAGMFRNADDILFSCLCYKNFMSLQHYPFLVCLPVNTTRKRLFSWTLWTDLSLPLC